MAKLLFNISFLLLLRWSIGRYHVTSHSHSHTETVGVSASKVRWPELSQLSLCSKFDKENSMEFSLISLLLIHFTTMAMHLLSHSPHVTLVMWPHCDCDPWHDHLWPSVTPLWHCDKVTWYFPVLHLVVVNKKRKKKKRNINNDLVNLPSHDREIKEHSHIVIVYIV